MSDGSNTEKVLVFRWFRYQEGSIVERVPMSSTFQCLDGSNVVKEQVSRRNVEKVPIPRRFQLI